MQQFPARVVVREVGLRDGLQSIRTVLATERKIEWIRGAHDAGQREIEVGSFVPAHLLPQLADTAELVAFAKTLPGLVVSVLVPNLKGAERAIAPRPTCSWCRSRRATRTAWRTCARRPTR
jgi:hydroxymethylglutaryl-CoA lyase